MGQTGKPKAPQANPELEIHKKIYQTAAENGDFAVALNSLYYIVAVEGKRSPYKDSLALLHFNMGNFVQCEKIAGEIVKEFADSLEKGTYKITMLEVLALCQSQLGKTKEAIGSFEKLLSKTNEMYHAYRLAELQFLFKRVGEALTSIFKAETLENSMQGPIRIELGDGRAQEVLLEAAVQNLKGYILLETMPNDKTKAIEAFKKALAIQPDFILAQNNLKFAEGEKPAESPK